MSIRNSNILTMKKPAQEARRRKSEAGSSGHLIETKYKECNSEFTPFETNDEKLLSLYVQGKKEQRRPGAAAIYSYYHYHFIPRQFPGQICPLKVINQFIPAFYPTKKQAGYTQGQSLKMIWAQIEEDRQ